MTLEEDLTAAFASDRFTQTVSDIETRAGLRRRRGVLRLAGVSLAVVVVAASGFLLRPKTSPAPVGQPTPIPSASASTGIDFEALARKCADSWGASVKDRPLPALLTRRASGGVGVLFYADMTSAFFCSTGTTSIVNPEGKPNPHYNDRFDHVAISGAGTAIFGWGPERSAGIEAFDDQGRVQYAERFGRIFFIWDYTGEFGSTGDGKTAASYLLFSHQADSDLVQRVNDDDPALPQSFDRNALTQVCQTAFSRLPAPGRISAAPANRFAFDRGAGKAVLYFGDQDTLISCTISDEAARNFVGIEARIERQTSSGKVFAQLAGVGFVFGRAPDSATSGEVRLSDGQTVALSLKDGFYAARWDGNFVPVRVQINTETERWVYESGQITKQ